ncbi:PQQ-binding-like beta-propeller repeat protein [Rhizohabitans arisaemae]|uniref:outer membrane protein assembly factor BamB family protein n=1 Tax=Rhizohabitans arisaemae TaxID=2720610 RepID=UPI0024B16A41|nr:PQQ-binding-like beta-propeller repeat protein [Rhizohabitans arisaemae]
MWRIIVIRPRATVLALTALAVTGCSAGAVTTKPVPTWQNSEVNLVSKTYGAGGVTAATSMRPDGALETVALETATGKRLWTAPAGMAGRLPGMGVQAPAVLESKGQTIVSAVEPIKQGKWRAMLITREARTGRRLWSRPVHSTFGPQRCGALLCLSEHTALSAARFVALDPLTGKALWRLPGIAEVQWADPTRVVVFRLAKHPVLAAHRLTDGKTIWRLPVEQAVGAGVNLAGGWAFGAVGDDLIGYIAPYTNPRTRRVSTFGLFSARLADGGINWMRPAVVRVYPSGSPAVAPIVRPVDRQGQYGGFARLDARSGRVLGQITAQQVPAETGWWLAFPHNLDRLGFLRHGAAGNTYDLASGQAAPVKDQRGWSFCVTDPKPLQIVGASPGFYPPAALCEYDLATGKRTAGGGAPPAWFTGSDGEWRLWRDEKGGLHAIKDASAPSPGMYG